MTQHALPRVDPHAEEVGKDSHSNARVIFTHPSVTKNDLVVYVNPDEITWAYGLNTANFPTYGGEVVQILSMFFDDMNVTGTVRSSRDIEIIYGWFLDYIQRATQGGRGKGSYDTRPVTFLYPARGWEFQIYPKALPTFRYGTEVVAPTWTLVAAVAEPETEVQQLIFDQASLNAAASNGEFETFGKATAAIGFREDNPWSEVVPGLNDPKALKKPKQKTVPQFDPKLGDQAFADFFNKLIPAYLQGDFNDLMPASQPPKWASQPPTTKPPTKKTGRKMTPSKNPAKAPGRTTHG